MARPTIQKLSVFAFRREKFLPTRTNLLTPTGETERHPRSNPARKGLNKRMELSDHPNELAVGAERGARKLLSAEKSNVWYSKRDRRRIFRLKRCTSFNVKVIRCNSVGLFHAVDKLSLHDEPSET
jgi:hypothetical protein